MEALHFLVLAGVELESPSGRPDSGDRNATTGDFSGFSHVLIVISIGILWELRNTYIKST